eukprot:6210271-Pleurochrysis_carterae.AAC.1
MLQRWTDVRVTCPSGKIHLGGCLLSTDRQSVALSALLAMQHFNDRDGRFVPALGSVETRACDKNLSLLGLLDTRGSVPSALERYVRLTQRLGPDSVDVVIGPGLSKVSLAVATLTAFQDVPIMSYSSTSPLLSSTDTYSRFMRTIPSDDGEATAICAFWRKEMDFTTAAVLYAQD